MFKKYAKYDGGEVIWEVEQEEGSFDIYIDDIQGDIMVCDIDKSKLEFVTKEDYDKRIFKLRKNEKG